MALSKATITGSYRDAIDAAGLTNAQAVFLLSGFDTESSAVVVPTEVVAPLTTQMALPADFGLFKNTAGLRGTWYQHVLRGERQPRPGFTQKVEIPLGNIQVGSASSYTITELLNNPVPATPSRNVNLEGVVYDDWAGKMAALERAPEEFGAVGDGTTNDATALAAWLAAGPALKSPGTAYAFSSHLVLPDDVRVNGDLTLVWTGPITGDMLTIGDDFRITGDLRIIVNNVLPITNTITIGARLRARGVIAQAAVDSTATLITMKGGFHLQSMEFTNFSRPLIIDGLVSGERTSGGHIGKFSCAPHIRGLRVDNLTDWTVGEVICQGKSAGASYANGHNAVLIIGCSRWSIGHIRAEGSGEHAFRVGGATAGFATTDWSLGTIEAVDPGGCAVKLNDTVIRTTDWSIGEIIHRGAYDSVDDPGRNRESFRATRWARGSIGRIFSRKIAGERSCFGPITLDDGTSLNVGTVDCEDYKGEALAIRGKQDGPTAGDVTDVSIGYLRAVNGNRILTISTEANVARIKVGDGYFGQTEELESIGGPPASISDVELRGYAAGPITSSGVSAGDIAVDLRLPDGRSVVGDATDVVHGSRIFSVAAFDAANVTGASQGGMRLQARGLTGAEGLLGAALAFARPGSPGRRGAAIAAWQSGANVEHVGLAIYGGASVASTNAVTLLGSVSHLGVLALERSTAAIRLGSGGPTVSQGSGSPEGAVTAPPGSIWLRTDAANWDSLWVKRSGSGNTGWIAAAVDPSEAAAKSAPAIIASAESLKRNVVTLRELVGRSYSSGNDGAATLNALTEEVAAAGLTIIDPDGMVVRLNSTLILRDDMKWDFGPRTTLLRGFETGLPLLGVGGTVEPSNRRNRVELRGGTLRPYDDTLGGGHIMQVGLNDSLIENLRILDFRRIALGNGGIAMRLHGDRNRVVNPNIASATMETGTGGIRILAGDNNTVIGGYVQSGDDALQFVPSLASDTHPLFNSGCTNSYYIGVTVASASKAIIAALVSSTGSVTGSTALLRACGFIGITGTYGTKAIYVDNDSGDTSIDGQVDGIVLRNLSLAKREGSSIGISQNAVHLQAAWEGAVRRIFMDGVTVDGTPFEGTSIGLTVSGAGIILRGSGNVIKGRNRAMRVSAGAADISLGGDFHETDGGATEEEEDTDRNVINIEDSAAGTKFRLEDGSRIIGVPSPTIEGVVTPQSGIRVAPGSSIELGEITVEAAAGSTGTTAVTVASGARATFRSVTTDCPNVFGGTGDLHRRLDDLGAPASVTIAGGVITMPASTDIILDTEGSAASDDLDTITPFVGIAPGQVITLRTTNSGRDVVVKHGTGNIKTSTSADITLTSTTSRIALAWDGVSWLQVGNVNSAAVPAWTLAITTSSNTSYQASQLARYVYIAGPLTRTPTFSMNNVGAVAGMVVRWLMTDTTQYSAIIFNGPTTSAIGTLTAPGDWFDAVFDGTNWVNAGARSGGGGTGVTVASLPAANTVGAGARSFVTDANATTYASIVAGGGSNAVPVYSDGTNWRIG